MAAVSKPNFLRDGRILELTCYLGEPKGYLFVRSMDGGETANVTFGQNAFRLKFSGSFLLTDYYTDGTVDLSLDPEGQLSGFSGAPNGTCTM